MMLDSKRRSGRLRAPKEANWPNTRSRRTQRIRKEERTFISILESDHEMDDDWDQLTALLNRMDGGNGVQERVFRLVYAELRSIAQRLVSREPDGSMYQATELLHETYLKKLRGLHTPNRSRQHFYSLAARAMRQVLIEEARRRRADKRQAPPHNATRVVAAGSGFPNPDQLLDLAPLLNGSRRSIRARPRWWICAIAGCRWRRRRTCWERRSARYGTIGISRASGCRSNWTADGRLLLFGGRRGCVGSG